MKPTETSSGSGGNHPTAATSQTPANSGGNQNPAQDGVNAREFPHFQSNFGFRPNFDDMFDDDDFGPHLRARMRRDPFAAFGGRKRCGFMPFDDPYRHYFADESDLFPDFHDPEWETMRSGRRRNAPQAGGVTSNTRGNIFDHIPAEFRNYIPDNFGFHQPAANQDYSQSYPPQQQHCEGYPQQQQAQPQQPQQQHYQGYVEQPQQQQYYQQPKESPRPKFCDASIQTDHDIDAENQSAHLNPNLNQHNLRNTMDFGQKSPQEGSNETRSHSAPPVNKSNYPSASAPAQDYPDNSQAAFYASTGTDPQTPQQYIGQPMPDAYQQRQQPQHPPPPPQRQYVPPQYQNVPTNPQYAQQTPRSRGPQPSQNDGGFVRHVPIFIEGRSEPVRHPPPSQQHQQPQQYQQTQQHQQPQQAPKMAPQEHHQQHYQPQGQHPERPTPLNTQQAHVQNNNQPPVGSQDQVPQTPHTAECITKIQAIQRDVLNLLSQVEQFTGKKQDREYLYLDEMLTRNLLKLDTIDTDGKDSIRLARREAIKCIQASINVLEAKAEENAKTAQTPVMEAQKSESIENDPNVIALPCSEAQLSAAEVFAQSAAEQQQVSTEENFDSNKVPPASETIQSDFPPEVAKSDEQEDSNETVNDLSENSQTVETAATEELATASEPEPSQESQKSVEESADQLPQLPVDSEIDNTLQQPPQDEATSLEPTNEQIEKSSSEKENKPPGSPKKKIIRKVKKVAADKKATSPVSDAIPNESPQKQETAAETFDKPDAN